jgi:choline kinase
MLDSRAPPGEKYSYQEQEANVEQNIEQETRRLMAETRLWRMASSAFWIAWAIVQAVVPGMPEFDEEDKEVPASEEAATLDSATKEIKDEAAADDKQSEVSERYQDIEGNVEVITADYNEPQGEEEEEFDYLGYAQERAMFLWGDAIKLGIITAEELPQEVRSRVKIVEY